MLTYWIKFKTAKAGCVEAADEAEAKRIATEAMGEEPVSIESLPYPADPRINRYSHPKYGECPSFCFAPERCKGNTSCPDRRRSCVE
jgi:hypothetical protein